MHIFKLNYVLSLQTAEIATTPDSETVDLEDTIQIPDDLGEEDRSFEAEGLLMQNESILDISLKVCCLCS